MNILEYSSTHPMRQAREFVVKALYQWLVDEDSVSALLQRCEQAQKPELCRKAVTRCIALYQDAVLLITPLLSDQQWGRLHLTEQAILVQVYYELLECPDVPYRVVINEAVELSKLYGGDESFRLINRLADRMALSLRSFEVSVAQAKRQSKSLVAQDDAE